MKTEHTAHLISPGDRQAFQGLSFKMPLISYHCLSRGYATKHACLRCHWSLIMLLVQSVANYKERFCLLFNDFSKLPIYCLVIYGYWEMDHGFFEMHLKWSLCTESIFMLLIFFRYMPAGKVSFQLTLRSLGITEEFLIFAKLLIEDYSTSMKNITAVSETTHVLQPVSQSAVELLGPSLQGEYPMPRSP